MRDKKNPNIEEFYKWFEKRESAQKLLSKPEHSGVPKTNITLLIMKYVRGDSFLDIKNFLQEAMLLIVEYKKGKLKLKVQYPDLTYLNKEMYIFICFAFALGVDNEQWRILTEEIYEPEGVDWVLDVLIAQRSPMRKIADVEKWKKSYQANRYGLLQDIISDSGEARASAIKKHLKKWHSNRNKGSFRRAVSYGTDVGVKYEAYEGQFAFELAAIVMAFDLDDSEFCEDIYYPQELVEYWRENFRN